RQEDITVTNITPAMSQILTAPPSGSTVVTVETLRYAFFLGDVLSRRDVARMRALAPTVTCINSYGATETQRALALFQVPAKLDKEIAPVGKGMQDVQ